MNRKNLPGPETPITFVKKRTALCYKKYRDFIYSRKLNSPPTNHQKKKNQTKQKPTFATLISKTDTKAALKVSYL